MVLTWADVISGRRSAPGLPNVYPADMALSLPAGRHSHGLARLAVAEAVCGSFDAAHAAITARCGNVLGKRQLQRLVQAAAVVDIDAFYQQRTPGPRTRDELLVFSCDAKGRGDANRGASPGHRESGCPSHP